ncbi:hypothetical protein FEM48_Zijuj01G0021800 [Ziziphus jujuba var. spinosa]|uniref:SURP and G-patch domain-containing protein 1-like protein n=1 Tax=Ziziphus jujuba var. spinosa TaxID=714518 RepID=A0A978VYI9_ZIZJJ|nr:hypothetical protein FEM48_Zijuj01G0021800 [Ziziphus jujuba var. spinosa]
MDKGVPPTLFVNDGSFMERFKQLQEQKDKKGSAPEESRPSKIVSASLTSGPSVSKTNIEFKSNDARKATQAASAGKLAFSLKQKSKLVAPTVKLGADEDDDESDTGNIPVDAPVKRQKLVQPNAYEQSPAPLNVAPSSPSDPTVKNVADKLASFVAKNGRQIEHITRQKNPGDTPFKFLFDESCADYKYYEYRIAEEEKAISRTRETQTSRNGNVSVILMVFYFYFFLLDVTSTSASKSTNGSQRSFQQLSNYQIPASALYEATEDLSASGMSASAGRMGDSSQRGADPVAMMEFYMKKAAQEEKMRRPKQSKDEMPPPASLQAPGKKGHHMGDYIPQEELEKFLAACNDAAARKAAKEAAERSRIQADNVGHKLLSKMGWKEGEGLGSSRSGMADPIMAGDVKKDNLGVGAQNPGEVTPEDDIYEQYKKRMMLGYRHRPNPLGNPRKAYY